MPSSEVILAVGAHPDDVELMCGGTLAREAANGARVHILTLADGVSSRSGIGLNDTQIVKRVEEANRAAKVIGAVSCTCHPLPDNRLDTVPLLAIVKKIEEAMVEIRPSIVFTHHWGDLNIDHRIVGQATVTACRPVSGVKRILFGEVPSATDYSVPYEFTPNWFED